MKRASLLLSCLLSNGCCIAQQPLDRYPFDDRMENVRHVTTYSSYWRQEYDYNDDGFLIEQINYYRGEKRAHYKHEYIHTDTLFTHFETELMNINRRDNNYHSYRKLYYDLLGRPRFYEYFSHDSAPDVIADRFIYDEDKRLLCYNWSRYNICTKKLGGTDIICNQYNATGKISSKYQNNETYSKYTEYRYDNVGRLTDVVTTNTARPIKKLHYLGSDSTYIVTKDIPSFVVAHNNTHTHRRYTHFDSYGNWTKCYNITSKGKKLICRRKIKYKCD
jgi:hypothetical protein